MRDRAQFLQRAGSVLHDLTAPSDLGGLRELSAIISQRLNNTEPPLASFVFAPAGNVLEQNIECVRIERGNLDFPA